MEFGIELLGNICFKIRIILDAFKNHFLATLFISLYIIQLFVK